VQDLAERAAAQFHRDHGDDRQNVTREVLIRQPSAVRRKISAIGRREIGW
jgi:hypothetical protein